MFLDGNWVKLIGFWAVSFERFFEGRGTEKLIGLIDWLLRVKVLGILAGNLSFLGQKSLEN